MSLFPDVKLELLLHEYMCGPLTLHLGGPFLSVHSSRDWVVSVYSSVSGCPGGALSEAGSVFPLPERLVGGPHINLNNLLTNHHQQPGSTITFSTPVLLL